MYQNVSGRYPMCSSASAGPTGTAAAVDGPGEWRWQLLVQSTVIDIIWQLIIPPVFAVLNSQFH